MFFFFFYYKLDIDECKVNNGGCSIGCENLIGSFKCTCPENTYTMAADGVTCLGKKFVALFYFFYYSKVST